MSEIGKEIGHHWLGGARLWGRFSLLGLAVALVAFAADQLHKYWMLDIYRIGERGKVVMTSFFDLVLRWNPGISYGLLQQDSDAGRIALTAVSAIAVVALILWIGNAGSRLAAISLGLIAGGALGNICDRIVHGAVADFFSFHYAGFYWYVFNIADVAITAGVIGLMLDWAFSSHTKVPKGV
ncbi:MULTISPECIES: signal peptidase II [Rhodomicrobium]|uniref:signal peptidase II n=1 Tax=Rhodomicrobium TaxID=1068 RepID=UPI000B4B2B91|nr:MULTISPECIES: signal peptidase II [Rhodomicrobium]